MLLSLNALKMTKGGSITDKEKDCCLKFDSETHMGSPVSYLHDPHSH
jgi:hypothetical protein